MKKTYVKAILVLMCFGLMSLTACGNADKGSETKPTLEPSAAVLPTTPTAAPTDAPTAAPTATLLPTATPTAAPTVTPTTEPIKTRPQKLAKAIYYTEEETIGKDFKAYNVKYGGSELAGNSGKKIIFLESGRLNTTFDSAISKGECNIEYITYNSGSENAFMLLDSNKKVLINVGGAKSGNLNMMPESTTSGPVSQWIGSLKSTWVKVSICIDLDSSNEKGIFDFTMNVFKTSAYEGENTSWTLIGSYDEAIYAAPGGQSDGANKAAAYANGAATDGFTSFDVAGIKIINAGTTSVYYDDFAFEATGMKVVKTLKEVSVASKPIKKEYTIGAALDLEGFELKGLYEYTYADGTSELVTGRITDYTETHDFSAIGEAVPVTIRYKDNFEYTYYVKVEEVKKASYMNISYTDEPRLDTLELKGSAASVHSGNIAADDNTNESNKIKISKGNASISFKEVATEGKVHFETEFLTKATSKASLFFRLVNSEGLPLIDIAQYGSGNLNMYLNRATSGDFAGQFKGIPVRKWAKAAIDIDLDKSKEAGHLIFTVIVWTTENYAEGKWKEFARFDETLYLNSITKASKTGAASTSFTAFDIAGIEFSNEGGSDNFYDNMVFEVIGRDTKKTLTKLFIAAEATKKEYTVGDSFNNDGLVLKGTYSYSFGDGTKKLTEEIISLYEVSFDNLTASDKSKITLTCDNQSTYYYVKVKANEELKNIAAYLTGSIDNSLVTLAEANTIRMNKRSVKLPLCYSDNGQLAYSVVSGNAQLNKNVLTVVPSSAAETKVVLRASLETKNTDGDKVNVSQDIVFDIPKAAEAADDSKAIKSIVSSLIDNRIINGQGRLATAEKILAQLDKPITTEELVAMLVELFDVDTQFTDVKINKNDIDYSAWYADEVIAAFQLSVEPKASRNGSPFYGIGSYLSKEDIDYLINRIEAIDKTEAGGQTYEAGLPSQEDSTEHLVEVLEPMSDLLAFPGADGYAKNITGGRGGKVIHVTNLKSSGEGSFMAALDNNGNRAEPRTIVFDVAGTIDWTKNTSIGNYAMSGIANVTIAGQTAPGEGITLTNGNFYLKGAKNVIIRFVHFCHGQALSKDDSTYIQESNNIMIDHCSFNYGSDECMSSRNTSNITIQWSLIADGVRTHSMGGLQEWNSESILHCLFANNNDRNPKAKGIMDFVNNVVYNWGDCPFVAGGDSAGQGWGNVVNNYFIAGLDTKDPYEAICRSNGKYMLYLGGNLIDSNMNGMLDGTNTGIDMISNGDGGSYKDRFTFADLPLDLIKNKMNMSSLESIDSAEDAYNKVVKYAGSAIYAKTDGKTELFHNDIDKQLLNGVINQTGKILLNNAECSNEEGVIFDDEFLDNQPREDVNNLSSPYYANRLDTDKDGMPDVWEKTHGLDYKNAEDRNKLAASGYTWLEEYLNELAAPAFPESAVEAATTYTKERTYILELEKDGKTVKYNLYQSENHLMVPLAPILEYIGYKVTEANSARVVAQYPYAIAANEALNLDPKGIVHTVKANDWYFTFSEKWNSFNDIARVYNDTIYVPITMIALASGAVYEQQIVDAQNNIAVITIKDAEIYKSWHDGSSVRNDRKEAVPKFMLAASDTELRLLFDKEAAVAKEGTVITITDSTGKSYSTKLKSTAMYGSNKSAAFRWSDFVTESGVSFNRNANESYAVVIESGAFADYYESSRTTGKLAFTISSETPQVVDIKVPVYADQSNMTVTIQPQTVNTVTEAEAVSIREALEILDELAKKANVNKTNFDKIALN